jgi:hypothetical protein
MGKSYTAKRPAGADGAAALADGEAQALVHGDRLDQLDRHLVLSPGMTISVPSGSSRRRSRRSCGSRTAAGSR